LTSLVFDCFILPSLGEKKHVIMSCLVAALYAAPGWYLGVFCGHLIGETGGQQLNPDVSL